MDKVWDNNKDGFYNEQLNEVVFEDLDQHKKYSIVARSYAKPTCEKCKKSFKTKIALKRHRCNKQENEDKKKETEDATSSKSTGNDKEEETNPSVDVSDGASDKTVKTVDAVLHRAQADEVKLENSSSIIEKCRSKLKSMKDFSEETPSESFTDTSDLSFNPISGELC